MSPAALSTATPHQSCTVSGRRRRRSETAHAWRPVQAPPTPRASIRATSAPTLGIPTAAAARTTRPPTSSTMSGASMASVQERLALTLTLILFLTLTVFLVLAQSRTRTRTRTRRRTLTGCTTMTTCGRCPECKLRCLRQLSPQALPPCWCAAMASVAVHRWWRLIALCVGGCSPHASRLQPMHPCCNPMPSHLPPECGAAPRNPFIIPRC